MHTDVLRLDLGHCLWYGLVLGLSLVILCFIHGVPLPFRYYSISFFCVLNVVCWVFLKHWLWFVLCLLFAISCITIRFFNSNLHIESLEIEYFTRWLSFNMFSRLFAFDNCLWLSLRILIPDKFFINSFLYLLNIIPWWIRLRKKSLIELLKVLLPNLVIWVIF